MEGVPTCIEAKESNNVRWLLHDVSGISTGRGSLSIARSMKKMNYSIEVSKPEGPALTNIWYHEKNRGDARILERWVEGNAYFTFYRVDEDKLGPLFCRNAHKRRNFLLRSSKAVNIGWKCPMKLDALFHGCNEVQTGFEANSFISDLIIRFPKSPDMAEVLPLVESVWNQKLYDKWRH